MEESAVMNESDGSFPLADIGPEAWATELVDGSDRSTGLNSGGGWRRFSLSPSPRTLSSSFGGEFGRTKWTFGLSSINRFTLLSFAWYRPPSGRWAFARNQSS